SSNAARRQVQQHLGADDDQQDYEERQERRRRTYRVPGARRHRGTDEGRPSGRLREGYAQRHAGARGPPPASGWRDLPNTAGGPPGAPGLARDALVPRRRTVTRRPADVRPPRGRAGRCLQGSGLSDQEAGRHAQDGGGEQGLRSLPLVVSSPQRPWVISSRPGKWEMVQTTSTTNTSVPNERVRNIGIIAHPLIGHACIRGACRLNHLPLPGAGTNYPWPLRARDYQR